MSLLQTIEKINTILKYGNSNNQLPIFNKVNIDPKENCILITHEVMKDLKEENKYLNAKIGDILVPTVPNDNSICYKKYFYEVFAEYPKFYLMLYTINPEGLLKRYHLLSEFLSKDEMIKLGFSENDINHIYIRYNNY